MNLFDVFINIAVNAEEINKKLNKVLRGLKRFVDACNEMADKCQSAFDKMRDGFFEIATTLGAINTYVKFFENIGKGFGKLKEYTGGLWGVCSAGYRAS